MVNPGSRSSLTSMGISNPSSSMVKKCLFKLPPLLESPLASTMESPRLMVITTVSVVLRILWPPS